MIGLGVTELLLLAFIGLLMIGAVVVIVVVVTINARHASSAPRFAPAPNRSPSPALSHQDVLRSHFFAAARQEGPRTCPRCRAVLAPDAPEGLCPACLMAGGLAEPLPPTSSGHGTPPGGHAVNAEDLAAAFPQLEILELLGQGGMGTVYKVRQKNLDRLAALKVIPPQAALDPTFAERFSREARALARLNHSNIVTVYDFGDGGGFYYLLMEYVDGPNLRQLMHSERIAPREALAIVPQICDALQYAHDQGIVHRDIKPENVLLDRTGRVKIADFGLAKLLGKSPADFTLTQTQQVMGTPRYMAPEQIERPLQVDHRADIYSLGVVLYEMLTGELPIGRFAPPSQKVEIDVRLDEIVLRTLEKEPQRRYQQVSQVKTEIESVTTLPQPAVQRAVQPAVRRAAVEPDLATTLAAPLSALESSPPPLGVTVTIAAGMIFGMFLIAVGFAVGMLAFVEETSSDMQLALLGSAAGILLCGAAAFWGCYRRYRQLPGAVDLLRSPDVTWFDYVARVYLLVGFGMFLCGVLLVPTAEDKLVPIGLVVMGALLTVQGAAEVLWRWVVRQQAAGRANVTRFGPAADLRPSFALAVVVPTLAIAAVWALVLLDFHFMTRHWPEKSDHVMGEGMTRRPSIKGDDSSTGDYYSPRAVLAVKYDHRLAAIRGLWIAAAVSIAVVFFGLAIWRAIGPRHATADAQGGLSVAPPFAHPAWPLAITVVSFATFVFPWVRLHFDSAVRDPDFKAQLTPGMSYYGDNLRRITGMPKGERYVATGAHHIGGAAAAVLAGAGFVLAVGMAAAKQPLKRAGPAIAIPAGIVAVLVIVAFAHQLGERDESLTIDGITRRGLANAVFGADVGPGSGPALALQEYLNVSPALGLYVAAGMAGLMILIGVTQWAWGVGAPELADSPRGRKELAAELPVKAVMAGGREAALQQVRAPALGLIFSGVLGLAPAVLLCVALSFLIVLPSTTPTTRPESRDTGIQKMPPPAETMKSMEMEKVDLLAATPVTLIPIAQSAPLAQDTMPLWFVTVGVLLVLLVLVCLPASILLIVGGAKMRKLQHYGLAHLAAIIALLPLGPQWVLSLPIGIWALIVLMRPEVKAAFE